MTLDQILNSIHSLPENSLKAVKSSISEVTYKKGRILLQAKRLEDSIYFIKKGMVRAFTPLEDNDITFWFGKEGDAVISMRSYVENKPSYETIELLEDSELYELKTADLQRLFETDIHIANWGRRFAERELIKTEERLISRQFRTAADRYKELLVSNSDLLQRVQLGHIASYLGITQVSLSRIRTEMK
jgi:CRP-like cAMP-binding protein